MLFEQEKLVSHRSGMFVTFIVSRVLTDALAIVHLTFNMMERLTDNRMAFRMRGKDKIEVC